MSGACAVGHRPRKHVRAGDEFGKTGVEEEGADEQIPRSTRWEEDYARA